VVFKCEDSSFSYKIPKSLHPSLQYCEVPNMECTVMKIAHAGDLFRTCVALCVLKFIKKS
jgi:hypothetical protein